MLPSDFEQIVQDHLDGRHTDAQLETLQAFPTDWVRVLYRFLDRADQVIAETKSKYRGPERAVIIEDFDREAYRIDEVLTSLIGPPAEDEVLPEGQRPKPRPPQATPTDTPVEPGVTELQLSWEPGVLLAWAGGRDAPTDDADGVRARLRAAGGGSIPWEDHRPIRLVDGTKAECVTAPIGSTLGWLVAQRVSADEDGVGATVPWLGLTTALAVRLTAQGRMVPRLRKVRRKDDGKDNGSKGGDLSGFQVFWEPALIDPEAIGELAAVRPGAAATAGNRQDGRAFTQSVLTDLVATICQMAAQRLEVPAPPPDPRSRSDVAETVLASLDGSVFDAPTRAGAELVRRLDQWSAPVTGTAKFALTIKLDAPDEGNAWHCSVLGPGQDGVLEPVEVAMVNASNTRAREMREQLARVERLFPELSRPGGRRRGEVILSQEEAWQLMSVTGDVLADRRFRRACPCLVPAQAHSGSPTHGRRGPGVGRRRPTARQRPLVGRLRRRRAQRRRHPAPRIAGPPSHPLG